MMENWPLDSSNSPGDMRIIPIHPEDKLTNIAANTSKTVFWENTLITFYDIPLELASQGLALRS
jgi:hypothetical protein